MSLITLTHTIHDDPFEELTRKLVETIDPIVNAEARDSYLRQRHEEYTTSRIAGIINSTLRHEPITAPGLILDVHLEEFTRSQESVAGADLYISLVRRDLDEIVSKGIIVQAKRRDSLLKSGEPERLGKQCKRMNRRSKKGAYVWVYDSHGATSIKAPQASAPLLQKVSESSSIGELIARGLRCTAGDKKIGRSELTSPIHGVDTMMRRLSVRKGLAFDVKNDL